MFDNKIQVKPMIFTFLFLLSSQASSPGKQIRVEFSGNFDFNEEGENSVCYDYVEVRYKGLERAGPR